MAAQREAFPEEFLNRMYSQLFDAPISDENTLNPDAWLHELTMHYLGAEPIIQSTHHFLRILKQDPHMSSQDWQRAVRLPKVQLPS